MSRSSMLIFEGDHNRFIEILDAADHAMKVVGVIGWVDGALLDEQEQPLGIAGQHLQCRNAGVSERRIFKRADELGPSGVVDRGRGAGGDCRPQWKWEDYPAGSLCWTG